MEALSFSEEWKAWCDSLQPTNVPNLQQHLSQLNDKLRLRTYVQGVTVSPVDGLLWGSLRASPVWMKNIKDGRDLGAPEAARWFNHMTVLLAPAIKSMEAKPAATVEAKKDQGSFEIDLPGAKYGEVVTRFPPEPSGYLHIGHAKAVLLNEYFARHYGGKLIIRFDDTNPEKEKGEYAESILADLEMLGVKGDQLTHTSDHFDYLQECCEQLIREGKAYADDTAQEQMRQERFDGIPSKHRDDAPEESMARWREMVAKGEECEGWCIRAKIDMSAPNKALRDPVIYRTNDLPHHRTGSRYRVYPTYDFACPIVDAREGVTHALRTDEYHDRNEQYQWFLEALNLRKVHIWDYSRLSFVHCLLSKRKLTWFVQQGLVQGWDDPRFPTVRGILRRGMTVPALREYILMQGASKNALLLEWDKIWAVNRKHIDPVAPRHTALLKDGLVRVNLSDAPAQPELRSQPRHKKNPDLGNKQTAYSACIFIEQADAAGLKPEEEVTLMDWGNCIIQSILRTDAGEVVSIEARLHLAGDFKRTEKKLTWLSPDPSPLIPLQLMDYDYLITKRKLEEEDRLEDFVTPRTEFCREAIGDANLADLRQGDIIQLERKAFFRVDRPFQAPHTPMRLIQIPDGKAQSTASKNQKN